MAPTSDYLRQLETTLAQYQRQAILGQTQPGPNQGPGYQGPGTMTYGKTLAAIKAEQGRLGRASSPQAVARAAGSPQGVAARGIGEAGAFAQTPGRRLSGAPSAPISEGPRVFQGAPSGISQGIDKALAEARGAEAKGAFDMWQAGIQRQQDEQNQAADIGYQDPYTYARQVGLQLSQAGQLPNKPEWSPAGIYAMFRPDPNKVNTNRAAGIDAALAQGKNDALIGQYGSPYAAGQAQGEQQIAQSADEQRARALDLTSKQTQLDTGAQTAQDALVAQDVDRQVAQAMSAALANNKTPQEFVGMLLGSPIGGQIDSATLAKAVSNYATITGVKPADTLPTGA